MTFSHWLVDQQVMMIDGIPNGPLYFYQKDIVVWLILPLTNTDPPKWKVARLLSSRNATPM